MRIGGGRDEPTADQLPGGRYFSVLTTATKRPHIVCHLRERRTENLLCPSGRIALCTNGNEVILMDIFEPFFDVAAEAADDVVYTEGLVTPNAFGARLAAQVADLDMIFVAPPPVRTLP